MTNNNNSSDTSRAGWLARGLEQLLRDLEASQSSSASATTLPQAEEIVVVDFDVVIVGSGYGGAIAADTFAGRQNEGTSISVCVLERGNEYLPGMFPHGMAELPGHVRRPVSARLIPNRPQSSSAYFRCTPMA